jgi:polyketide synthase PksN
LAKTAQSRPDHVAVVTTKGAKITLRDLEARAGVIAAQLHARGAGPGSLVGLYIDRTRDMVAAVWGILAAGAAYVPLDPAYPTAPLAFMCADARLPLFDTQRGLREDAVGLASSAREIATAEGSRSTRTSSPSRTSSSKECPLAGTGRPARRPTIRRTSSTRRVRRASRRAQWCSTVPS